MRFPLIIRRGVLLLIAPLAAAPAWAEEADRSDDSAPLLWVVTHDDIDEPSFLFGTIHLPDERVKRLQPAVRQAFAMSGAVYTELPMETAVMMEAAQRSMLPDGKMLIDVLPEKLYERTEAYVTKKAPGFPFAALERLKVWAIAVQLSMLDIMEEMARNEPLDMTLYNRAKRQDKEVGGLETLDEQIGVFDSLSTAEQIEMLEQSLQLLEDADKEGRDMLEELTRSYLKGDEELMVKLAFEYLDLSKPLNKKIFQKLLIERDERMAERIAEKVRAAPDKSFFFAVGAMHMAGEKGVDALLEKDGFEVRRVTDPRERIRQTTRAKAGS